MKKTFACCCLIGLSLAQSAQALASNKVAAAVLKALQAEDAADVLIVLPPAELDPAWQRLPFVERTAVVSAALRSHAEMSQAELRSDLFAQGIRNDSLWISNSVVARLTRRQLEQVSLRKQVLKIEPDAARRQALEPLTEFTAPPKNTATDSSLEANLQAMNVEAAWQAGARGAGVVVGGQDTGYDWTHPALRDTYLGWNGQRVDHQYHWYDAIQSALVSGNNPCGFASSEACDDDGHGTHTMGTAVGGGVPKIGVAPQARWIGCRNMDAGVGRPSTYLRCFQFFLAPTNTSGEHPRPELAPHVVINSWGCPVGVPPRGEDCQLDSFDAALANMKAAGILIVVAAGNGTAGCGTITDPPAISADALVVGATNNTGVIAPFSLWGPIIADGSLRLKPDLTAPGTGVLSSVPGGGYGRSSGTSMATPAVVGVSALMLGANPLLIGQPDEVGRLLKASAVPALYPSSCGGMSGQSSPNMVFGWGTVDAGAAVEAATRQTTTPGHSGAWYDPSRNGEGWILHVLEDGRVSLVWYTFPAANDTGEQAWLVASDGRVIGDRVRFDDVYRVTGGRFGSAFDAAILRSDRWGSLDLQFSGCDTAELSYVGPAAFGSGQRELRRLTQLAGHRCGQPAVASSRLREQRAGAWFDPARVGEGWLVEPLSGEQAALTWFTFTPEGEQAWLYGVGRMDEQSLQIDELRVSRGTRFGDQFDSSAVQSSPWGRLRIEFDDCRSGQLSYAALDPTWGSGVQRVSHLSEISGLACTE